MKPTVYDEIDHFKHALMQYIRQKKRGLKKINYWRANN